MVTKIVVNLELGHVAKTLDVPTFSGHTHEWVMFVKGAEKMAIEYFVEKVVFWLHDSYDPPKVVVKSPPYQVKQSGYAGFNILVDIHFKNRSEPKSVRFHYDLFLHNENMPPVNHTRVEMLTFTNPADDFKKRLIRAGGIVKTQESQTKERKSHKDVRHSQEKQSRSSKEKHESEKPRHKTHHSDSKSTKSSSSSKHSAGEEKRRSSVSEEIATKRKHQEKTSARPSGESKSREKEKPTKTKFKTESSSLINSLFAVDDSIHVKQIKKKESSAPSHEPRKDKEKREKVEPKIKKEVIKQEIVEKIRVEPKIKKEVIKQEIVEKDSSYPSRVEPKMKKEVIKQEIVEKIRVEPKIKKEVIKQEILEKKIRKQSPVVAKVKPPKEVKVKRPRSPSSSDESEMLQQASAILAQPDSDSDSRAKKKKKKHTRPEKMKKMVKRSKNTPDKVVKQPQPARIPQKEMPTVRKTPEKEKIKEKPPQIIEKPVMKPPKKHRKTSESSYVEKKRKPPPPPPPPPAPEKPKSISNSPIAKVTKQHVHRSSTPTMKKEKQSSNRCPTPVPPAEVPIREKKPIPVAPIRLAMKETKVKKVEISSESSSSSSSSSSEDEMAMSPIRDVAVPKQVVSPLSPMSSSSSDDAPEVPSFGAPPEEPEELSNIPRKTMTPAPVTDQLEASDDEETFHPEENTDQLDTSLEASDEKQVEKPAPERRKELPMPKKLVEVGQGELRCYPHMNDELFEKLKQLQQLLSAVTDATVLKKIISIVRKSGKFTLEGKEAMNFDFCSLDQKTVNRIEKYLKATGDK